MAKILSLIGTLITGVGTALYTYCVFLFRSDTIMAQDMELFFLASSIEIFDAQAAAQIAIYFGIILIFISGFIKGNNLMGISGIISIIACLGCVAGWLVNDPTGDKIYGPESLYFYNSLLLVLGLLLYFIGCIKFREKNKIAWLTATLLFLISIIVNVFFGVIAIWANFTSDTIFNHLQSLIALYLSFFLHGFVFIFSKKKSWADHEDDDELSISSGGVFASYVPTDDDGGGKRKKAKKSKEDLKFNF